ncbi:hypothetical protein ABES02_28620 [Neobacillus pocheonensis]|uniref:hypothetical protein n=1 Tax=Neobacillus pocheonensis TaxID=363869 RepID=UPI003D2E6789
MKDKELKEWERIGKLVTATARERAFAAGSFISYGENGKVIREYPDGRRTEVIRDEHGNRKEIDYASQ